MSGDTRPTWALQNGELLHHAMDGLREPLPERLVESILWEVGLLDRYAPIDTDLGRVFVAWSVFGVTFLYRADDGATFLDQYDARIGRTVVEADALPRDVARAIRRLDGGGLRYDLRVLTEFERSVLETARKIPKGEVRPYNWIAREIGRDRAVRAVGSALGRNPVPILIPCHRVVRSDSGIGNYIFGPEVKRLLLVEEDVDVASLAAWQRQGVLFVASATTKIFCNPSCRSARRIREENQVPLRTEREAFEHGFRPCKQCRPAPARAS